MQVIYLNIRKGLPKKDGVFFREEDRKRRETAVCGSERRDAEHCATRPRTTEPEVRLLRHLPRAAASGGAENSITIFLSRRRKEFYNIISALVAEILSYIMPFDGYRSRSDKILKNSAKILL